MRRTFPIAVLLVLIAVPFLPLVSAQEAVELDGAGACDQAEGVFSGEIGAEMSQIEEWICKGAAILHIRGVLNDEPTDVTAEWALVVYGSLLTLAIAIWLVVLIGRTGPRRVLKLKAANKIAEVAGGQAATYAFTLTNRRARRPATVELSVSRPPQGWEATFSVQKELPSGFKELVGEGDHLRLFLSARKNLANKADITLTVKAPRGANPEEWAELDVSAVPFHKESPRPKKAKEVRIVTLVRAGETKTAIADVVHTPEVFRAGDEVTSIVRLRNTGEVDTSGLRVRFSVNGQDVDEREAEIKAGLEEEIRFHWTAPEGKARVRVALA